jgi:hypothetical protein
MRHNVKTARLLTAAGALLGLMRTQGAEDDQVEDAEQELEAAVTAMDETPSTPAEWIGQLYQDRNGQPCLCISHDDEAIYGVSVLDGSQPHRRSIHEQAPTALTITQVQDLIKEHCNG